MFREEIDFAFFAARLGWSYADYRDTTPVQRMFIRKELETVTVDESNLTMLATQRAIANVFGKKAKKLWTKRRKKQKPPLRKKEIRQIKKQHEEKTPWTPWSKKEVANG